MPLTTTVASEASSTSDSDLAMFEISQADSEVSFSIYEELAGQPKTVVGVTDQVAGQIAINLGDLTIRNVTQPVVFEATVQGDTTTLTGTATTVINRTDYNLTIPNAPSVANVGAEVTLEINSVAQAAD